MEADVWVELNIVTSNEIERSTSPGPESVGWPVSQSVDDAALHRKVKISVSAAPQLCHRGEDRADVTVF